jgi:hypothetical protein
MSRTRIPALVVIVLLFTGVGWALQATLARLGAPAIVPPWTFAGVLVAIGVIVLALAWRVRSRTHRRDRERREHGRAETEPVDPFFATRVLLLAKASSVTAAVLAGTVLGLLVHALLPPATPVQAVIAPEGGSIVAAIVLGVCGLVAELWCRVPPSDDGQAPAGSGAGPANTGDATAEGGAARSVRPARRETASGRGADRGGR